MLKPPQFTVFNIDILNVKRNENYNFSHRNGRPKHGFIYVISGKMQDIFYGKHTNQITISKGDLIFIPKGSRYSATYLERQTEIKIIQFDLKDGTLPEFLSAPLKIDLPQAAEIVSAFFKPTEMHQVGHPFYYLSCLYEMLWRLEDCIGGIPQKYKKLQPALIELVSEYKQNEKVGYYADLCNMSEANFRRLFHNYFGISPIEYRNNIRLNNAKAMLQSGEYNVSEASAACGFSNLSFFIRLYKKKFGITPKRE